MFQPLIEQAHSMISRLHASTEQGRDSIPDAQKVRPSEFEAWETAAQGVVNMLFGPDGVALARWHALAQRRGVLMGDAMRKDRKRGEYVGLIDYFHLAIGMLLEFEAAYQHRLTMRSPAPPPTTSALAEQPAPRAAEPIVRHSDQELPNHHQQAARVVGERWEFTIAVTDETYRWLNDMAAAREPAQSSDGAAQLAATIIERVAANTRHGTRQR